MASERGQRTLSYSSGDAAAEVPFRAPYLAVALDCERPAGFIPERISIAEVEGVRLGRGERQEHRRSSRGGASLLELELADRHMSSDHAELQSRDGAWWLLDRGSKNGTFVGGARVSEVPLRDGDLIEVGNTLLLFRDQVDRLPSEPADVEIGAEAGPMATLSPPLAREVARVSRCADTLLPVLITGPSGTGKEVAARWIHRLSGRRGELVAINCAALPPTLIESELFGARRGAYSGADRDRLGLIRAADGGTLFLDEIGELPPASQVKLLRVLQEKEVTPVGGERPTPVDIRVVAATLTDVDEAVEEGRFRPDLLARLAGFRLRLPALAERREDIGLLVARLLARQLGDGAAQVRLERAAGRALLRYSWPLNIRELEQALGAATALADGHVGLKHLPEDVAEAAAPESRAATEAGADDEGVRQRLVALLRRHGGNVSAVARDMGKARVQVRRWCRRFEIDIESFRD